MKDTPAFPVQSIYVEDQDTNSRGMTLLDYFAAKAMQALLSNTDWRLDCDIDDTAKTAYMTAKAMMKAREA
jgi:hypothetical protein